LAPPNKGQSISDAARTARCRRHPPNHDLQNVSLVIDDLFSEDQGCLGHPRLIYGILDRRIKNVRRPPESLAFRPYLPRARGRATESRVAEGDERSEHALDAVERSR